MSKYLDALASERAHNAKLTWMIVAMAIVAVVGMVLLWSRPKQIDLHLSPDIRAGDTITASNGIAPIPSANVYSFAYYIWQQVNRWQTDGGQDYGKQIFSLQAYLTPSCQAQLQSDLEARDRNSELRNRVRQITEIQNQGFQPKRVIADGQGAWSVLLDMQVMESVRGQPIKDTFIRYPVRVVRYDVDREKNPFMLAVDCFGNDKPARLEIQAGATSNGNLPGIAPAALPGLNADPIVVAPTTPTPVQAPTPTASKAQ